MGITEYTETDHEEDEEYEDLFHCPMLRTLVEPEVCARQQGTLSGQSLCASRKCPQAILNKASEVVQEPEISLGLPDPLDGMLNRLGFSEKDIVTGGVPKSEILSKARQEGFSPIAGWFIIQVNRGLKRNHLAPLA